MRNPNSDNKNMVRFSYDKFKKWFSDLNLKNIIDFQLNL